MKVLKNMYFLTLLKLIVLLFRVDMLTGLLPISGGKPDCHDVVMDEAGHTANHGSARDGFLPVEGGYIVVDEAASVATSKTHLLYWMCILAQIERLDTSIYIML